MGIYTSNRFFGEAYDYASEIPANEAYDAAFGCAHILADCQRNDMALFEHSIFDDMAEVRAIQEGTGYVNENAFTNVIKKIVEMFKKLLAKIKGIFKAFLAKLSGAFTNGKDLVKKYEKQIIKYSNWDGLKIKGIRVPNDKNIKTAITNIFNSGVSCRYEIKAGMISKEASLVDTGIDEIKDEKKINDADAEDIKTAIIKKYLNGVSISDYKDVNNDIMDKLFKDEDTLDGEDDIKSSSFFSETWIKTILSDDKWESEVKKFNDRLDKNINTIIDNLNKTDENLAKYIADGNTKMNNSSGLDGKTKFSFAGGAEKAGEKAEKAVISDFSKGSTKNMDTERVQKAIHALQKLAGNEQEVITKVTSEYMGVVKFSLAQARKIWTAAAAWSSGIHKESVEYYQALGESAAEEFYMNMEAVC